MRKRYDENEGYKHDTGSRTHKRSIVIIKIQQDASEDQWFRYMFTRRETNKTIPNLSRFVAFISRGHKPVRRVG